MINIATNTNLKYANSSSNYYVIMIIQNFKKIKSKIKKFQFFSHSRCTKCRFDANNNHEAVVVNTRHVVKRPSKRSVLLINYTLLDNSQHPKFGSWMRSIYIHYLIMPRFTKAVHLGVMNTSIYKYYTNP